MQGCAFPQNNESIPHNQMGIFGSICQWVTQVSLSDWPPSRQESGGLKAPAIERPSFGRGCITAKFMRSL